MSEFGEDDKLKMVREAIPAWKDDSPGSTESVRGNRSENPDQSDSQPGGEPQPFQSNTESQHSTRTAPLPGPSQAGSNEAGSDGVEHQWKCVKGDPTAEGVLTLDAAGGFVSTQGSYVPPFEVLKSEGMEVSESGTVILTIIRNDSSRAIESGEISFVPGDPVESLYFNQSVPLAKATLIEDILTIEQLKFEELHIFEDLAVVDGEFKLVSLLMSGRNPYDPPPA